MTSDRVFNVNGVKVNVLLFDRKPDELAQEIADDLQTALEQFGTIGGL